MRLNRRVRAPGGSPVFHGIRKSEAGKSGVAAKVLEDFACGESWYPRPELNGDPRFRKPLLYPFELQGPGTAGPIHITTRGGHKPQWKIAIRLRLW